MIDAAREVTGHPIPSRRRRGAPATPPAGRLQRRIRADLGWTPKHTDLTGIVARRLGDRTEARLISTRAADCQGPGAYQPARTDGKCEFFFGHVLDRFAAGELPGAHRRGVGQAVTPWLGAGYQSPTEAAVMTLTRLVAGQRRTGLVGERGGDQPLGRASAGNRDGV